MCARARACGAKDRVQQIAVSATSSETKSVYMGLKSVQIFGVHYLSCDFFLYSRRGEWTAKCKSG